MDKEINKDLQIYLDDLMIRHPELRDLYGVISEAYNVLESCFENNGKLLIAGNGGSASDSEHISGELLKSFKMPRPIDKELRDRLDAVSPDYGKDIASKLEKGLPAVSLVSNAAFSTAFSNDVDSLGVFAQQVLVYGQKQDVFLGISTSGNSKNVVMASIIAEAKELKTIALTGYDGGELAKYADVVIAIPETETYLVQELHIAVYHCLCMMLEKHFFG